jgi:hypothetical protein
MTDQDGLEEIVVFFDDGGTDVVSEHKMQDFEALTAGNEKLEQFAASVVKAAYGIVSSGLVVRGLVFFLFKVDEDGYVMPGFNLPLQYLANTAGGGPDLGHGPVHFACRGQCPVPWHAINLWEPQGEGEASPAMLVQKMVWRNRLELKPVGFMDQASSAMTNGEDGLHEQVDGFHEQELHGGHEQELDNGHPQRALEDRLTETFGEEGKVSLEHFMRQNNDQLLDAKQRFRDDLHEQQQTYLDQIRGLRDDMQELKVALRHEQDRNRRLQELLRGDV